MTNNHTLKFIFQLRGESQMLAISAKNYRQEYQQFAKQHSLTNQERFSLKESIQKFIYEQAVRLRNQKKPDTSVLSTNRIHKLQQPHQKISRPSYGRTTPNHQTKDNHERSFRHQQVQCTLGDSSNFSLSRNLPDVPQFYKPKNISIHSNIYSLQIQLRTQQTCCSSCVDLLEEKQKTSKKISAFERNTPKKYHIGKSVDQSKEGQLSIQMKAPSASISKEIQQEEEKKQVQFWLNRQKKNKKQNVGFKLNDSFQSFQQGITGFENVDSKKKMQSNYEPENISFQDTNLLSCSNKPRHFYSSHSANGNQISPIKTAPINRQPANRQIKSISKASTADIKHLLESSTHSGKEKAMSSLLNDVVQETSF